MLKMVGKIVGALVLVLAVAVAAGFGYRAYRQHQNAEMLVIKSPNGVSEAGFVKIGGMDQYIQVRGEDRNNPVILFLHGGPGYSAIPFNYPTMRSWEKDFTIVDWDQRGSGKTFIHNKRDRGANHTIAGMTKDGIEVAGYVRKHLGKDKIIILGHSWGSVLGTEMARQRPDLFYAYVGTGQAVDIKRNEVASYEGLMAKVRAAGDKDSEAKLKAIGAPPYASAEQMGRERGILSKYPPQAERDWKNTEMLNLLFAPGYSIGDAFTVMNTQDMRSTLMTEMMSYNGPARGTTFEIPMFYFQGAEDLMTPTSIVQDYFQTVVAPRKELVLFPGAGHSAINVSSEAFREEMVKRVRPLAVQPAKPAEPVPAK